jgi:hypothetical protein
MGALTLLSVVVWRFFLRSCGRDANRLGVLRQSQSKCSSAVRLWKGSEPEALVNSWVHYRIDPSLSVAQARPLPRDTARGGAAAGWARPARSKRKAR